MVEEYRIMLKFKGKFCHMRYVDDDGNRTTKEIPWRLLNPPVCTIEQAIATILDRVIGAKTVSVGSELLIDADDVRINVAFVDDDFKTTTIHIKENAVKAVETLREYCFPTFYTGKIVCIASDSVETIKGKIYEVENGKSKLENGATVENIRSLRELSRMTNALFVELVE